MVAHRPHMPKVAGSSPAPAILEPRMGKTRKNGNGHDEHHPRSIMRAATIAGGKYGSLSGMIGAIIAAVLTSWLYADTSRRDLREKIATNESRLSAVESNRFTASDAAQWTVEIAKLEPSIDSMSRSLDRVSEQLARLESLEIRVRLLEREHESGGK